MIRRFLIRNWRVFTDRCPDCGSSFCWNYLWSEPGYCYDRNGPKPKRFIDPKEQP